MAERLLEDSRRMGFRSGCVMAIGHLRGREREAMAISPWTHAWLRDGHCTPRRVGAGDRMIAGAPEDGAHRGDQSPSARKALDVVV